MRQKKNVDTFSRMLIEVSIKVSEQCAQNDLFSFFIFYLSASDALDTSVLDAPTFNKLALIQGQHIRATSMRN